MWKSLKTLAVKAFQGIDVVENLWKTCGKLGGKLVTQLWTTAFHALFELAYHAQIPRQYVYQG